MKMDASKYNRFIALCDSIFKEVNFHLDTYIGFEKPFRVKAKKNKFESFNTEKKRKIVLSVGDSVAIIHISDKFGDIVKLEYEKPSMISFGQSIYKDIEALIDVCNKIYEEVKCQKKS